LPEGARAGGGIGCHTLALWMDRRNEGLTQMGGEGANWVGEAPFSTRPHMFQNMGDGTYNHSGLLAIRHAVGTGTNITYKILCNDAVAMTGGQGNDGGLTPERIAREVLAAGVAAVALVHDPAEGLDLSRFPPEVTRHARDDLISVQERLSKIPGVTVLLYVQTCAAEKRRRRRAGRLADPDLRVMIDPDVCEGCGDCGVQSNCVAILPLETELGRKRQIDQSACNKDVSCLKGFCPAFVTVAGARPRRPALADLPADRLPDPVLPAIAGTTNLVLTGIGGTGVVTIGAVLAMAAHLDGKAAGMIEMAGMAQKGGAVTIHCRIAERPEDIAAVRVSVGECDLLLGGDLVVSAGPATLSLLRAGRTRAVLNGQETPTGAFTRDRDFRLPMAAMTDAIARRVGAGLRVIDAGALALRGLGDSLFANMVLLGAAWQMALVPLSREAIAQAIRLNGAAVETNLAAFALGRLAAAAPDRVAALIRAGTGCATLPLEARIERLAGLLATYQDGRMADRYRAFVRRFADPELRAAVAEGYHRVLYVKDEYEVARLLAGSAARAQALFEGDLRLTWHLAPPFLPGRGPDGRPRKRAFGAWMAWVFPWLARGKRLRGTPLDPFGWTAERRADRRFAATYEADMEEVLRRISPETRAAALALARLPCDIRGFGPVRAEALARATLRREELLARLRGQGPALPGPEPQATAACAAV
jgi:indolepyruvate ferredoxin oxidoreductase